MKTPDVAPSTIKDRDFLKDTWTLLKLFWRSSQKKTAFGLLGIVIFLLASLTALEAIFTYWQRALYDALQQYDWGQFTWLLKLFVPLASLLIVLFIGKHFVEVLLKTKWRQFLTQQFVQKWLTDKRYYLLQFTMLKTDNPDQRLAEDLEHITSTGLSLFVSFVGAFFALFVFLNILWTLSGTYPVSLGGVSFNIPGHLVLAAFVYSVVGTYFTRRIMRPFPPLYVALERTEGSFRYALARVREYGESVAFYHGEEREDTKLKGLFAHIYSATIAIARKMIGVNLWLSFYGQLAIVLPFLLMAPRYFKEKLAIGILIQVASSFGNVQNAFSVIVNNYPTFIALKASIQRILAFDAAMEALSKARTHLQLITHKKKTVVLKNLTLQTPEGKVILKVEDQTLEEGTSVLIKGPSGVGKSTLLRALSGMWPFGEGAIIRPEKRLFFIPQKPYLPLGTLREALAYPQDAASFNDKALCDVLDACGLAHLKERLSTHAFWTQILSGGEAQRLAFARLLLFKPDWAFLDEATSALDGKAEAQLYQLVQKRLPRLTMVSVGHKPTLDAFHQKSWHLAAGSVSL